MSKATAPPRNILVIRRDNIGDLICTTPLLSALRRHFPSARIAVLVNSYNAPVLSANPDADEVLVYRKAKHRAAGESRFAVWLGTLGLLRRLRRARYDVAIIATPARSAPALRFARWSGAARRIGYGSAADGLSDALALDMAAAGHETEAVMRLLQPLGIDEAPGPLKLFPLPSLRDALRRTVPPGTGPVVGLHISARKPSQRWPAERFSVLARSLAQQSAARMLLFWAPGAADDPRHPGDDAKAAEIMRLAGGLPLAACSTHHLEELIAGLSLCDRVICADGGAMHIAAGLGKPIVCLFGNSGAQHWHPWGVPHELLQAASLDVRDIQVEDVVAAWQRLESRLGAAAGTR